MSINPTKAALISGGICFLLGWLFFCSMTESEYIDLLETQNNALRIQNQNLLKELKKKGTV